MVSIENTIKNIVPNSVLILSSEGEWALHDLLPLLLSVTGPANVSVASFSISEEAVRCFMFEQEKGNILNLRCLLDYTMRSHKVDLMLFLEVIADELKTAPNHSKLILIENTDFKIAVVGSANLTPNPRLELAIVFCNSPEFLTLNRIFSEAWKNSTPF